jgi:hypothetical protein
MIVFKTYSKMMSPRIAVAACFLFAMCYKYNWFDGYYIPESLGILFFAMAFYAVMRTARGAGRSAFLILALSVLPIVVIHFFSSFMLSISLGLCYVLSRLLKRLNCLRLSVMDLLVAAVPCAAWLSLVALAYLTPVIGYRIGYSQSLVEFLTDPFGQQSLISPEGIQASGIHLSTATQVVVILGFLFGGCVGL